jgi:hypothetical protein
MSLSKCITVSIVIHLIVLLLFSIAKNKKIDSSVTKTLIVSFAKEVNKKLEINSNDYVEAIAQSKKAISTTQGVALKSEHRSDLDRIVIYSHENNIETDLSELRYFSINEVDIKALPISNIDMSMIANIPRTGQPVKLRIYISLLGKIDTIERLSNLEQDEEFLVRLEYLLKETTFLPAKKNGTSVSSVQDVEFSI